MTTIKTKINGEEWEIAIDDGLTVEFEEGKLTVKKAAEPLRWPQLIPIPIYPSPQPYLPLNPYPITGTITTTPPIGTWGGGCW